MEITIQKVFVDCDVAYYGQPSELGRDTEDMLKRRILPLVEETLTALVSDSTYASLNRLSLNLDIGDIRSSFDSAQVIPLRESLKQQIVDNLYDKAKYQTASEAIWEQLIFIIKNGYTPWGFSYKTHHDFELALLENLPSLKAFSVVLIAVLGDINYLQRFSNIYTLSFSIKLLKALFENIPYNDDQIEADIDKIIAIATGTDNSLRTFVFLVLGVYSFHPDKIMFSHIPKNIKQIFKSSVGIKLPASNELPLPEIKELRSTLLELLETQQGDEETREKNMIPDSEEAVNPRQEPGTQNLQPENAGANSAETVKDGTLPWQDDGVYIQNAGLVIIANFLPHYFARLGLIENNSLIDPQQCVHLLQMLSGAKDNNEEYNLVLNKILCGLEPEEVLNHPKKFGDMDIAEGEALLNSLIQHWSALKSTSPETVQHVFFQREGKIYMENEMVRLKVEEKTEDVLLQFLPWSISMIKLPWMKYMLNVEWTDNNSFAGLS